MKTLYIIKSWQKSFYCLISTCFLFFYTQAQTADDSYKTGTDLCDKGQFESAIPYFDKAISLNPNKADYYNGRGRAYIGVNKHEKALEDCNKAISMDSANPYFFNNRGRAYFALALYDKAFPDFNQAVILKPKVMYSSHTNIGLIFNIRRQYELALKAFSEAISINPTFLDALTGRANTYSMMGRPDDAINDCNAAIKIAPDLPYAYYLRGIQYSIKNQNGLALADYNKCIDLKPKVSDGYYSRGNLYSKQAYWDMAINDYSTAIQLSPTNSSSFNARSFAYLAKGNYEAAINDLKKAISLDTKRQFSNYILNIIEPLARLNRFSEAASYWQQYLTNYPKGYIENANWAYFKKYFEAITVYVPNNKFTQALTNLDEADQLYKIQTEPTATIDTNTTHRIYSSLLALRGYLLIKLQKPEEARKAYTQSLLINPSQPDVVQALQSLSQNKVLLVKEDKEAPKLNILEPANNSRSISIGTDKAAGVTQKIRGQAIDPSGIRSVKLNNNSIIVEENGYFETTVTVLEGVNTFSISVTDKNNNTYVENIHLTGGKINPSNKVVTNLSNDDLKDEPMYHAVLIAENNYKDNNIKSLERPEIDLNIIYDILVNRYSFQKQNVIKLVNPGRAEILETIMKKANDLKENDNLLIFYAGHGEMIKLPNNKEEGFLLPSDATKGSQVTYIRGDDLIRTFEFSKAKHILVIADACFAGSLLRNMEKEAEASVVEAYKDQSRKVMASGNRTVVPDESAFIANLRTAFLNNRKKYITAEQLLNSFKDEYTNKTRLNLQYYPIAGLDLGGQFVFKRKQ